MLSEKEIKRRIEVCRAAEKHATECAQILGIKSHWGRTDQNGSIERFSAECEAYREAELLELKRYRKALVAILADMQDRDELGSYTAWYRDAVRDMRIEAERHLRENGIDLDAKGGE